MDGYRIPLAPSAGFWSVARWERLGPLFRWRFGCTLSPVFVAPARGSDCLRHCQHGALDTVLPAALYMEHFWIVFHPFWEKLYAFYGCEASSDRCTLPLLIVWTVRYLRNKGAKLISVRPLAAVSLFLGLSIGYIMMIVLLLHEGVDHAL